MPKPRSFFSDVLSLETPSHQKRLQACADLWRKLDRNGNGFLSQAEVDKAVGEAMGAELRASYNLGAAKGLDIWGPVINLNRDPR